MLLTGIALHVYPAVLAGEDRRAAPNDAENRDVRDPTPSQATLYWIQVGSFQTLGRAETFGQTLSNRLNRNSSVPNLEVQVPKGAVTGCAFDRVVVIPSDPGNNAQLEEDLRRVRVIVDDALLRGRQDMLNSQSECR